MAVINREMTTAHHHFASFFGMKDFKLIQLTKKNLFVDFLKLYFKISLTNIENKFEKPKELLNCENLNKSIALTFSWMWKKHMSN